MHTNGWAAIIVVDPVGLKQYAAAVCEARPQESQQAERIGDAVQDPQAKDEVERLVQLVEP